MSKFEKVHKDFDKGLNCLHFTSLKVDLCQDINRVFSLIRFFVGILYQVVIQKQKNMYRDILKHMAGFCSTILINNVNTFINMHDSL